MNTITASVHKAISFLPYVKSIYLLSHPFVLLFCYIKAFVGRLKNLFEWISHIYTAHTQLELKPKPKPYVRYTQKCIRRIWFTGFWLITDMETRTKMHNIPHSSISGLLRIALTRCHQANVIQFEKLPEPNIRSFFPFLFLSYDLMLRHGFWQLAAIWINLFLSEWQWI